MSKMKLFEPLPRANPRIRFLHSWKHVCLRQGFGGQPSRLASRSGKAAKAGGASRDRTDDLKLAKLALSQLSYGPIESRGLPLRPLRELRGAAHGGPRRS